MNHDLRFKNLIRAFFADFIRLFFPKFANQIDFDHAVWLEKELVETGPERRLHALDVVARVPWLRTTGSQEPGEVSQLALVYIEVESQDRTTPIESSMAFFYSHLRYRHRLQVLPIVIFFKESLDGAGMTTHSEYYEGFELTRFRFLYVGLPGLDAVEYSRGDNWLGVALSVLMRIPPERVIELGTEVLRRLAEAPLTDQQRFLLVECVQAYLPITETQKDEYERILFSSTHAGVKAMNQTIYEKGLVQGRLEGNIEFVVGMLENQLGTVSEQVRAKVEQMSNADRQKLAFQIPSATSFRDLGLEE